jgi:hypothetical protein
VIEELKRRLREQSEHYLLLDSADRLRKGQPSTFAPYRGREGRFWRLVFVPLYRRIPWAYKRRAMDALKMTASGWTPPPREPGQPWRPPKR